MSGELEGIHALRALAETEPDLLATMAWAEGAHKGQTPPPGDWTTWLFLGGRGAGKTRAGAEWVCDVAGALGRGGRIALVGATLWDARAVMVEGPSGVMNLPWRTSPVFEPSLRRVTFPGGATGHLFSAEEPERLRGPQFHAAWGDELCAWGRGRETLANLRLGLRLEGAAARGRSARDLSAGGGAVGDGAVGAPRLLLTSTPKPTRLLRELLAEPGLGRTHAATGANRHLAAGFLETMQALYGGTRRAAQELDGLVLEVDGALFTAAMMAGTKRLGEGEGDRPACFDRVVVAVDPPAGTLSGRARDACGIVAAGRVGIGREARAVVLADRTVSGLSPEGWAARVRRAAEDFGADRVVVETN